MTMTKEQNFSDAFDSGVGSCRGDCACGKVYYDTANRALEDEELEELEGNPHAIAVEWSVGFIEFEGQTFVRECGCWHERSRRLMNFIDGHAAQIARYLNKEKKRISEEAKGMPEIIV